MKVLFIALVICAVALATSVPDKDKIVDKAVEKNKTVTAEKPTRDARYYLLDSGRVYDRYYDSIVPDVVLDRSSYVINTPVRSRSSYVYY